MTSYNKLTKYVYKSGKKDNPGKIIEKLEDGKVKVRWLNGQIETISSGQLIDLEFSVDYYKKELQDFETILRIAKSRLGE